ncbi:hypothetical protein JOD97_002626 [Duganella sp. 1411]|uniref:hypothetical protein n=1 Tax=Duganella sp. 1411 TaxID=2806572 RepID=UPI001AE5112C|nr:hypothetical protein [Duganella sp. 1411]MBP1204584.1 hypothetical protein [Duganella sp. 1411]
MKSHSAKRWLALAMLLCLSASPARAAADRAATEPAIPVVEVPGTVDDRDEKSYRDILAGMDVFDRDRDLAPGASLRFRVWPRQAGVSMDGLVLQIAGARTNIPVSLAADQTFVVPRHADAVNDNAVVQFNRKAKSLAWRADVRSPGVPPNARRLGDLLLECKVAMAGDLLAYVHHPINVMVTKLENACRTIPLNMFFFADRPVFSITLVDGERRAVMPAAMLHGPTAPMMPSQEDWMLLRERVFMVKFKSLYDKGWSDATLLRFDYMDDEPSSVTQAAPAGGQP